jgi:hypothetical protein
MSRWRVSNRCNRDFASSSRLLARFLCSTRPSAVCKQNNRVMSGITNGLGCKNASSQVNASQMNVFCLGKATKSDLGGQSEVGNVVRDSCGRR